MTTFPAIGRRATRVVQAVLGALLLTLLFAVFAPQAGAQGYSIYANCNRADGWQANATDGNWAAYNDCGGWRPGMKAYVVPHNDARTGTGGAFWSFNAPAGTRIVGLQWDGYKYHGWSSGGWIGGGWLFRTTMFGDGFRPIDGQAICDETNIGTGACYSGAASDPAPRSVDAHYVGGLNDGVVAFGVGCVPAPNPCPLNSDGVNAHGYTRAALAVQNMRVDVRDDWDPSIKAVSGSVTTGGWKRGTVDLTVTADDNSGICGLEAEAGGQHAVANHGRDSFALKQCADVNGERFAWDTSGWSDGAHNAAVWVSDAAGRGASWGWQTFYVDNHAPSAPSNLSIDGGEGWSTSNSRTIRWSNPGQGSGSPINGSHVQVCKTGTSNCRATDAGGSGVVSGVSAFDGPGDYTVRVSLKDEAGNHNASSLSNGVRLKFDNQVPGEAEQARANGWQNAVERAAYQQHIKMRDNAFKPVSGIAGYSITTNGSDPDNTIESTGVEVDYPINNLPEGINTVKARAVSGAGVASNFIDSHQVKVDLSKPAASVAGAPDSAKWQNQPVDLELKGTDQPGLSGMDAAPQSRPVDEGAYIAYRIDGGELQKVGGASAPVTVGNEGEHTVTYYAVDFAGNESETQTVQFKIDRTNPTAGATSDAIDPNAWQRESVSVTLTGDDGQGKSGMDPAPEDQPVENGAHLVYRLNTANVQRARGASATFKVDDDGDHTVTYYAIDGAGNESEHKTIQFRIDKTAPSSVVFEPQGSDKRRLEVAPVDATSGVGEVQVGIRRVGGIPQEAALKRLAKKDPARYRRAKLRGTRRTGNRLVDCRKKSGKAKRACQAKRRKQLKRRHRIAPLGEGWTMLPTTREGDKWVAYIPNDHSLRMGTYQMQAVVQDQAGNEASGDRFRGGQPGVIIIAPPPIGDQPDCCQPPGPGDPGYKGDDGNGNGNGSGDGLGGGGSPLDLGPDLGTIDTKIAAGAVKKVKVKRKLPKYCKKPKSKAQKKKCAKARKPQYKEQFVPRIKVKFGRKAMIRGALTTSAGAPIADGTIDVITTASAAGHQPQVVGAVRTDRTGAFSYKVPAGSSRKVTFRFRGLGDYRRSEGNVDVQVPGAATLKSSKKRVKNGDSVTFSGKLLGKPLPARGKVVDLQAFYRGKWRTFATPRANKKGQFKFRYRFEATRSTTTYKFRARLRAESAYPFELGYSKVVSVRVRGR